MTFQKLRIMVFFFAIGVGLVITAPSQECGPGCPVCSGSGSSTGALLPSGTMVSTIMSIPNGEDETAVLNLRAGLTSWLDVGLGYTVKSKEPI